MNPTVAIIKRIMDIVISISGIIIGLPLFTVIPLLIKLDSDGPVFFIQERVGLNGKNINIIKFRTMKNNAEKISGPVWAEKNDPRITRIGRFLRKARMDEIPQFYNVLKGEMSIVGPRPERPAFVNKLENSIPFYDERIIDVKPGITGLAQVNIDYDSSLDSVKNKLLYDHAYGVSLTRLSSFFAMEFSIIAKTLFTVLTGKGAN